MFDAQALIEVRRMTSITVAPDATWAAVGFQRLNDDKTKYQNQLLRLDLKSGKPSTLTLGESDRSPTFLHDGRLAFLSNRGDEEAQKYAQIYAFQHSVGEPEAFTDEALGVQSFVAAKSSNVIVCTTPHLPDVAIEDQRRVSKERKEKGSSALIYNQMPVRFWDHWLPNTHTHVVLYVDGQRTDLTPIAGRELEQTSISVSPNGQWVTWIEQTSSEDRIGDTAVVLYHVASQTQTRLFGEAQVNVGGVCWSPDSGKFAYERRQRVRGSHSRSELYIYDVAVQQSSRQSIEIDHQLSPVEWVDGQRILMSGDVDTSHAVFVLDTVRNKTMRVTAPHAGGAHRSLQVVDGHVFGLRSRLTHPAEPFVCELSHEQVPRLVATLSGFELPTSIEIDDHRVCSTDGQIVQYFTVHDGSRPVRPSLMWIHGGPVGQWGDDWHWRWNPIVGAQQGYLMVLPNPRGSTGFGYKFVDDIFGNTWGGQCYQDLMVVTDDVSKRPDVDAKRMNAMGGSFGGYMTNWIGTQTDRFRRLVTHAGLFDLAMFHGVTDAPAWWAHAFNIAPFQERSAFASYSPIEHLENWKTPTLIIHGDLDYRVPVGEALALFEGLQDLGIDSKLLIFPDENHWILKPQNILMWYGQAFEFLAQ